MSFSATTNFNNSNPTPAQEEFQQFLDKNTDRGPGVHPEDADDARRNSSASEQDEEDQYRAAQIDAAMRMPSLREPNANGVSNLPPAQFDAGRSTGVKGVIADARAYEQARQDRWRSRIRSARKSVFGGGVAAESAKSTSSDGEETDEDEEAFMKQWRDARKMQLEAEARNATRTRRTSPSLRMFGRFDTVDALGYLDAIEKVGRETTVVVFVYDHECQVSALIESALRPLVTERPEIHFVKVHYEDIEFDNAAVPTVLAYRNQGDLFANMTGIIDMIPENEEFDTSSLQRVFEKHGVM